MIIDRYITNDGAEVAIWQTNGNIEKTKQLLTNFDEYKPEFEKLKTDKRKLEFLAARIILNTLLNRKLIITYLPDGKPILKDLSYNISISHSCNLIAVIVDKNHETGIDIECRNNEKIEKVRHKFLSDDELKYLFSDTNDRTKIEIAWSAKEALYKIIGKDAVDFKKQLRILPFELNDQNTLKAEHMITGKIYNLNYHIAENYILVHCISK